MGVVVFQIGFFIMVIGMCITWSDAFKAPKTRPNLVLRDCFIELRKGDKLFDEDGVVNLERYTIKPMDDKTIGR